MTRAAVICNRNRLRVVRLDGATRELISAITSNKVSGKSFESWN